MKEYGQYFEEIRKRLLGVVILFGIGTVLGFVFSGRILLFCLRIFNFSGVNITLTSPTQLIDLSVYTGLLCGFLVSLPVFLYQAYLFISPAFSEKELLVFRKVVPFSILLFLIGSGFGGFVTQMVIVIYSKFSEGFAVNNIWDIQKFFSQVLMTGVLTGLIFQMPIVVSVLIRTKVLTRKWLAGQRRYVYAGLMLLGVLLPPTDVLSLVLLVTPLLFLFEFALLLNIDSN